MTVKVSVQILRAQSVNLEKTLNKPYRVRFDVMLSFILYISALLFWYSTTEIMETWSLWAVRSSFILFDYPIALGFGRITAWGWVTVEALANCHYWKYTLNPSADETCMGHYCNYLVYALLYSLSLSHHPSIFHCFSLSYPHHLHHHHWSFPVTWLFDTT